MLYRVIIGLIIVYNITYAEEINLIDSIDYNLKPRYGIYSNYNFNFYNINFKNLPGYNTCCPSYNSANDNGFAIGLLFEYPLDYIKRIGLRLGLDNYNAKINSKEQIPIIIDGKSQLGEVEYLIDSKFANLGIEPSFLYSFDDNFWAFINLRLGINIHSSHLQTEKIISPIDMGSFIDGKRLHNISYGELPNINKIEFGFRIGLSYERRLNKDSSLFVSPEISYGYNFTPVIKDLNWYIHLLKFGLSIKYKETAPPPPPPPPPLPPPFPKLLLPEAPPILVANTQVFKIDSLGKEEKNFNIQIEDFISLNMRPLLNYVFFDHNSADIPNRYVKLKKNETANFTIKSLQNLGALETYYNVLNIIGLRLKNNPESTIEIVGCNSNINEEKNNIQLSRNRALAVREYLENIWGIDPIRMPIKARNLPEKASRSDDSLSIEENRRVEIITNDFRIIEPVTTTDTMRVVDDYNLIFKNTWKSDVGIENWELKAEYDNKVIFKTEGKGVPDSIVNWKLSQNGEKPKSAGSIFYSLKVQDKLGQITSSPNYRLPIEQLTIDKKRLERIADREFEYYSLILFDFGKSELRNEHKNVVDFVKNRITSDSKVYIRGYTDIIGEDEVNKKLSEKRAFSVAKRLNIPLTNVEGIGELSLLYPNDTPEGRFYCRTVQIIIETPVKD